MPVAIVILIWKGLFLLPERLIDKTLHTDRGATATNKKRAKAKKKKRFALIYEQKP